jgi:hypothetical protein
VAILIGLGHSVLAMSGEETMAQVYREIETPKLKNLKITANIVCVFAVLSTGLITLLAGMIIPDSIRPEYQANLLGGLTTHLAGPAVLRLGFHIFVVIVGVLILSGAVNTSIEELFRWDQNWYDGKVGGKDLLEVQQRTGRLTSGEDHGYAAVLFIGTYRGLMTVRHGGAWAGYRAELLRFPDQRTSVACLCNRGDADPSGFADQVADVVLAPALQPKAAATNGSPAPASITLPAAVLAARAGVWRSPKTNDIYLLETRESQLLARFGARTIPLTATSPTRFVLGPYVVLFEDVPTPVMKVERDGRVSDTFERLPPSTPDPAGLGAYAGLWFSEELGATWRLVPEGNGLRVEVRDRPNITARAVAVDLFSAGSTHLTFVRDRKGVLTGFTVNAGRVRGIGFTRVTQ